MNKDELISHGMAIAVHAAATPDRVAIVSEHGDRTWAELNGRANQLVRALRTRGLQAGDAVALMCSNRPEFAELYAATLRAGLAYAEIGFLKEGRERILRALEIDPHKTSARMKIMPGAANAAARQAARAGRARRDI